jgi:hypothetical protein
VLVERKACWFKVRNNLRCVLERECLCKWRIAALSQLIREGSRGLEI